MARRPNVDGVWHRLNDTIGDPDYHKAIIAEDLEVEFEMYTLAPDDPAIRLGAGPSAHPHP